MPAQTKLQVLLNGIPLVGATVWLGEVGGIVKTTNENGECAYPNIVSPWQGYVEVFVQWQSTASAKTVLIAGETTVIDLGTITEP